MALMQLQEEMSLMQAAKKELPRSSNEQGLKIWDRDICLHLVKASHQQHCKRVTRSTSSV